MNQRLLVIIAVLLLVVGASGLLMSGQSSPSDNPEEGQKQVTYFVTARALSAGSRLTDDDFTRQTGSAGETPSGMPDSPVGYYLQVDKAAGERLSAGEMTLTDPADQQPGKNMIRYSALIPERYTGAIQHLRPGDWVDVYLRFDAKRPETQGMHRRSLINGESRLNLFRIFKARRVISRPGKASASLLARQSLIEVDDSAAGKGSLSVDIELSQADLKRLFLVTAHYELVLFPVVREEQPRVTAGKMQGKAK
ncbi:SAF domain-containing protein [Tatumella terrea]|uniref:SAF domain-containing protein n=1 Tax=Tatumella terrea TaxID=419007 RepID=A0ABW1VYR1_9GAMM